MTADDPLDLSRTVGWRVSRHARNAMAHRGFTMRDVLLACTYPEITESALNYGPGRRRHKRGDLVAVVAIDTETVITVLLRSHESWTDTDSRNRPELAPGQGPLAA